MRSIFLYFRLAFTNLKANSRMYIPYFLASVGMIILQFILCNLSMNPDNGQNLGAMLGTGMFFLSIFVFIFIFYINSFLIKRRIQEFGLYNILGMEKKQIGFILFIETVVLFLLAFVIGIAFGCLFSKAVLLLICKLTGIIFDFPIFYSIDPFIYTFIYFAICFLCTYIYTVFTLYKTKLIELLHAEKSGEKEPKTKILLCIIGLLSLGIGYYLALTISDVYDAISLFLIAAILVMIGTYCLFSSVFLAVLKLLKKNNKYYYQKNHFINLSSMLFRMKQNAVGLSNLCILSCMIIVIISMTLSIYFGSYDILEQNHQYDVNVTFYAGSNDDIALFNEAVNELVPDITDSRAELRSNSYFLAHDGSTLTDDSNVAGENSSLFFYSLASGQIHYDELKDINTQKGHVILVTSGDTNVKTISINGYTYIVDKVIYKTKQQMPSSTKFINSYEAFSSDIFDIAEDLIYPGKLVYYYEFNTSDKDLLTVISKINDMFASGNYHGVNLTGFASSKETDLQQIKEIYGELLFIGIFLGLSFVLAAGLIIYYKQITEGYDDLERYHILQQVGLSEEEVKSSINSQIVTIFFLPLIVAIIHVMVAFHIEKIMLQGFSIFDPLVLLKFDAITISIFAILYYSIYRMTSRTYYNIIKR